MAYGTKQDMIDRFGQAELVQLTDIGPVRADVIVDAVLLKALDDASAEVDGYCSGRYQVPLSPVPPIVTVYVCDIARYRLQVNSVSDQAKARYDAAVTFFTRVAKGEIKLPAVSGETPPAPTSGAVVFEAGQKAFGRENFDR